MTEYSFKTIIYRNITPLHIGCGQDIGLVDNPIIRERTTQFPFIPGSGIRGALRVLFDEDKVFQEEVRKALQKELFGPDPNEEKDEENEHSGCVSIHDAKILFFPVRTDKDIFHWITSPYVIKRFNRDMDFFKCADLGFSGAEDLKKLNDSSLKKEEKNNVDEKENHEENYDQKEESFIAVPTHSHEELFLEEFPFKRISDDKLNTSELRNNFMKWLNGKKFGIDDLKKVLIISDQAFDYFARNATMVMQHNRLTSAKTVESGALFSVEALPPETIFYGIFGGTKSRAYKKKSYNREEIKNGKIALKLLLNKLKQQNKAEGALCLGGDESTGLGVTRLFWLDEQGEGNAKSSADQG
ncbi:MAG: type III-B CRISPR module RAMP protein Cmr4 [Candidatus Aminicenantes bacterium]|nr:type III-B CRISPR module RAMP protein Cmr4 [Candidatus Aminicenantes bacterium]